MKTIFLPFYCQCPQHRYAASARIRAEWPAKYLKADIADPWKLKTANLLKYKIVIFQKCYNQKFLEVAQVLKRWNPKIILALDMCDAEWTTRPDELLEMTWQMNFITVSTEEIKKWFITFASDKPCYVIPDGHDLDYYQPKEEAEVRKGSSINYVWYGNSGTIKSLEAVMYYLEKTCGAKDSLTVIADDLARDAIRSDKLKVEFKTWKLGTVNDEVRRCDIALNPRLETESYKAKSNNKTAMAYIIGLPCIDRSVSDETGWINDLTELRIPDNRAKDLKAKRSHFIDNYGMEKIAGIWKEVLDIEFGKCYNLDS